MRELTLLDAGYLAGLLLLSLVLPLLMSFRLSREALAKRSRMRTVWVGQSVLALAGLIVLVSAALAPYAVAFGLAGCVGCAFWLLAGARPPRQSQERNSSPL